MVFALKQQSLLNELPIGRQAQPSTPRKRLELSSLKKGGRDGLMGIVGWCGGELQAKLMNNIGGFVSETKNMVSGDFLFLVNDH